MNCSIINITLKNIYLVSMLFLALQSSLVLALGSEHGVYVRSQIKPADEATEKIISIAEKTCELVKHKKIQIFGLANYSNGAKVEEYYSADGAYMAIYTKGYRNEGKDVCILNYKAYEDIQIYHIKQQDHYSYQSYKNVWAKTKQLSMTEGGRILELLNVATEERNGKAKYLGEEIFQSKDVQALTCHKYQFKEITWCEWRKDSNKYQFLAPVKIVLKGRAEKLNSTEVKEINFNALIPAKIFQAPEKYQDMSGLSSNADKSNATYKWCLAQKEKTGVNPCEEDDDE
jgi:hypothetical protein